MLDESGCKLELVRGLRYKKPVIPLRLSAAAELPFRLGSRQYIDFSDGFERGLARRRASPSGRSAPPDHRVGRDRLEPRT